MSNIVNVDGQNHVKYALIDDRGTMIEEKSIKVGNNKSLLIMKIKSNLTSRQAENIISHIQETMDGIIDSYEKGKELQYMILPNDVEVEHIKL